MKSNTWHIIAVFYIDASRTLYGLFNANMQRLIECSEHLGLTLQTTHTAVLN